MFKFLVKSPLHSLLFVLLLALGLMGLSYTYYSLIGQLAFLLSISVFVLVAIIDLRDKEIDLGLLIFGFATALLVMTTKGIGLELIIAPIAGALIPGLLVLVSREKWMGLGDVVLAAWAGALAGFPLGLFAILFAFLLGSLSGIIHLGIGRRESSAFAFAPYLLIGCLYSIILSDKILAYFELL